jgi:hypothetical protein
MSPRPSHSAQGQPDNASDPYFMSIRDDLADKGFFGNSGGVRACLLRCRDDADVNARAMTRNVSDSRREHRHANPT